MSKGRCRAYETIEKLSFLNRDEHDATAFDSNNDDDDLPQFCSEPQPQPQPQPVAMFDHTIYCISCDKKTQQDEQLLVCSESGCPVTVHANCIGSQPKFDDAGNFYCPYCCYKRAVNTCQHLSEKLMAAKQVLSSFLKKNAAHVDPVQVEIVEETETETETEKEKEKESQENKDEEIKVKVSISSVSETNDSESVKKTKKSSLLQHVQRKHYSTRRKVAKEEEVTSLPTLRQRPKRMKRSSLKTKRKRLLWTAEEEQFLKEGVSKFSTENQNIPWRKILEFGCRVFDKTRTPVDLKDKWKNIISKFEELNRRGIKTSGLGT